LLNLSNGSIYNQTVRWKFKLSWKNRYRIARSWVF